MFLDIIKKLRIRRENLNQFIITDKIKQLEIEDIKENLFIIHMIIKA